MTEQFFVGHDSVSLQGWESEYSALDEAIGYAQDSSRDRVNIVWRRTFDEAGNAVDEVVAVCVLQRIYTPTEAQDG